MVSSAIGDPNATPTGLFSTVFPHVGPTYQTKLLRGIKYVPGTMAHSTLPTGLTPTVTTSPVAVSTTVSSVLSAT